jgi:hypothetical protein
MEIEMDIDMESLGDLSNAFLWEVAEVLNEGLDVTNGRSLISIAGASHANEHWFAVRVACWKMTFFRRCVLSPGATQRADPGDLALFQG